jgi:multicomponent K+:H+ antiporter subunit E
VTAPRPRRPLLRRLLPAPALSAALLATWLMLNESVSVGHLLLGGALALALPWFTRALGPEGLRLRRGGVALRLLLVVLKDIVLSNLEVARRVLGPEAAIRPVFVEVPLAIRDPHGITTLAAIITMTPGTLSSDLDEGRTRLLVHALHCEDPDALVADIKARYEAPLMEIFG